MVKWLIRSEQESNEEYGESPENRDIESILQSCLVIVDKHNGPTSHQITAWVKKILGADNAGHAGTLDPAVSGVLPIAVNDATKSMPVLMGLDKEYIGIMHVHRDFDENMLRTVIKNEFLGEIEQTPPVKSAVARRKRTRKIHFLDILEIDDRNILFHVGCEAGTYIRKLCHDIGESMGTGAHMIELRRIRVGPFNEDESHTLMDIKDSYQFWKDGIDADEIKDILIPIEHALLHVKRVFIKDSAVGPICNGAPLYVAGITRIQPDIIRGEKVLIYTDKGELVALGIAKMTSKEMMQSKRGTAVRTDRVFMERGTYPTE